MNEVKVADSGFTAHSSNPIQGCTVTIWGPRGDLKRIEVLG